MRHATPWLLVLFFWVAPAFSQSPSSDAMPNDPQLIRQIEDDLLNAERHTDPAVLERVLADDYVNLGPNGLAPGKADLLKNFRPHAGEVPPYTVDTSDMHVYLLGETAVAACVKTYTAKENGNVAHEDTTHIFTRDHGSWKLRISRASIRQVE